MPTGTIKRYDFERGFGFITPDGKPNEVVFLHVSALKKAGLSEHVAGTRLEYELGDHFGRQVAADPRLP